MQRRPASDIRSIASATSSIPSQMQWNGNKGEELTSHSDPAQSPSDDSRRIGRKETHRREYVHSSPAAYVHITKSSRRNVPVSGEPILFSTAHWMLCRPCRRRERAGARSPLRRTSCLCLCWAVKVKEGEECGLAQNKKSVTVRASGEQKQKGAGAVHATRRCGIPGAGDGRDTFEGIIHVTRRF
ncbi:hypothetical protein C8R44DRAFT_725504 [Mycena epipterygia]|nr:hypothetical protein C8R44DRAFT_725504 [Mycena epipterygia]